MNDIQDMIGQSVNRLFADMVNPRAIDAMEAGTWPAALWDAVEASGLTRVLLDEEGGAHHGAAWANALPVLQAVGAHQVPLPLAETMVAHFLLSQAGLAAPTGPLTFLQVPEQGHAQRNGQDADLALRRESGGLVLHGNAQAVPWARWARGIVVAGVVESDAVVALFELPANGIAVREDRNIAGEPRDDLRFEHVAATRFAQLGNATPPSCASLCGALARATMMAGAAQSVLRQSVQYANDRVQFGRPIGKFQAIQQSLAILAGEVTSARTAAAAACEAARPFPRGFDVAVAKIRAGQAAGVVANIAHQVHGAMGFTHEHSLHYATRRLWSWRAEFGAESVWAAQLGRQAMASGGSAFWRDLTGRQAAAMA